MLGASAISIIIGCSGTDDSITQESITKDSQPEGFNGLESVETRSASQLTLRWNLSSNSEVTAYNVYDVRLPSAPVLIKTVPATANTTIISGLNEGFLYRYRVRSVVNQGGGESEDGNENDLFGIPYGGVQNAVVVTSTSAEIFFRPVNETEALQGRVYCREENSNEWTVYATVSDLSQTSAVITGLQQNTTYVCRYNISIAGQEDNSPERVTFTALGRASRISFLPADGGVQPGNGQSGELLSVQPQVVVLDENDNIVAGGPDASALITLTISVSSPTGGTIRGTASMNAVQGVATFTDLFLQESGAKILTATKQDTSSLNFGTASMTIDSDTFNVLPSTNISPSLSSITISPTPSPALIANGSDTYQVTFTLRDDFGNPVSGIIPNFASNVLGDFLSQPTTPTDAMGQTSGSIATTIADTNSISVTRTLNVSSPSGLEVLTVEAPFSPGPANRLAFTIQPQNSPAGANGLNDNLSVSVQDSFNNLITTGAAASSPITVTISNNVSGATLTGTATLNAANGTAVFSDLGIDQTGNGYRLAANSGALQPTFSNSFNITSGTPRVIAMEGPTQVISGGCSSAITLQLRDFGGNPATAVQNTTIQLSGLGSANLYSNTSCSGAPLSNNVTFTPGTDTRTLYLSSDSVENLNILGEDTSSVLQSSNYNIQVTPSRIRLVAEAAPPVAPGNPLEVPSDSCSTSMSIVPLAEDGSDGQFFSPTTVRLTGFTGSQTRVYSDPSCSTEVDVNSVSLDISAPPNQNTLLYVMGPRSESLLVNVSDPNGEITTVSPQQTINILASEIDFTGPSTVVSQQCSTAFNIRLEDSQGNVTVNNEDITLSINGLESYSSGRFYTTSNCTGPNSRTQITFPSGNSSMVAYFRGTASAQLNIFLSDSRGLLNDSQMVNISVSPSDLELIAPGVGGSDSNECAGPFTVRALDGNSNVSNVLTNTRVNLSGAGDAGFFYSDSSCETSVNRVQINSGSSSNNFWFAGYYPEASLTLTVADHAGVLNPDSASWSVNRALGFIGSTTNFGPNPQAMPPFSQNVDALRSDIDGFSGAWHIAFDPTHQFLYVVDQRKHKVLKYDYLNEEYIGWIGRTERRTPTQSNLANPSTALCVSSSTYDPLPGWCVGGRASAGEESRGGLHDPRGITVDDTYVYVVSLRNSNVNRYVAETGEFAGWIGTMNSNAGAFDANDDGIPGNDLCPVTAQNDPTPTWCIDGSPRDGSSSGNGEISNARSIAHDDVYLYVGTDSAVVRFNKTTGAFSGWIGRVDNITPTGNAPGGSGVCAATPNDTLTPGWCIGGNHERSDARNSGFINYASDVYVDNSFLYVMNNNSDNTINRYDKTTGQFLGTLSNQTTDWGNGDGQMAWDPVNSRFLIANRDRVIKIDTDGLIDGWLGKVANNFGMSGPGCASLAVNENTPGWCIGGSHKPGLDERSFSYNYGMAHDGNGHFITVSNYIPKIQKFDASTGNYVGSWAVEDTSPERWIADYSAITQGEGFKDESGHTPRGVLTVGDFLFVTDQDGSRIKKLNKKTGEVIGWVGGITTVPSGGQAGLGCTSANAMGPSPGWCSGAEMYPYQYWNTASMIDDLTQGIVRRPWGLASDGVWLFVTDQSLHSVHRFRVDDGSYGGWLGRVSNASPTGGPGNNCLGAANDTFTDGWCFGGRSESGPDDGNLDSPQGITYASGNIYVVDFNNHRINSYNATTGQFNGWIGRIDQAPSSGCTPASNGNYQVSNSGWCLGGRARRGSRGSDRGGAFSFNSRADIFSDGLNLYVTNTENSRIDKYNFSGEFIEATSVRRDEYSNTWESDRGAVASIGSRNCGDSMSVWADATHIYGLNGRVCDSQEDPMVLWKMDKSTGTVIGWQGGVGSVSPTGGESGCFGATSYTPSWCQGGRVTRYDLLGGFQGNTGMIHGDDEFIYITDAEGNRVIRVPK